MKTKKIVLVLTVVLMGTIVMNAQPPRRFDMSPEQMVEKRVERLDRQLGLTAEQKAEIARIYSEEMTAAKQHEPAMREKGAKPDEAEMKAHFEEMKARQDATNAKIEALLTPEQAAKFAELKNEEGKRGRGWGHKGPRGEAGKAPRHGCCDNCTCKDK